MEPETSGPATITTMSYEKERKTSPTQSFPEEDSSSFQAAAEELASKELRKIELKRSVISLIFYLLAGVLSGT
jgi:hypothetical protein